MINAYCSSLEDTFAQWVYYGLISEEDAQCFSVESAIEPGFFFLAIGAVILALVNTFVNKAAFQYFRDIESVSYKPEGGIAEMDDSLKEKIRPIPVLFSDTFRWLLVGSSRSGDSDTDDFSTAPGGFLSKHATTRTLSIEDSNRRIGKSQSALQTPRSMSNTSSSGISGDEEDDII